MRARLFFVMIAYSFYSHATLEPKCIRTRVLEGNTCRNLKVDFDFGLCGVAALTGKTVKSTCVNQKAVAFVKGENEIYIATYGAPAKEDGKWKFLSIRKELRSVAGQEKPIQDIVIANNLPKTEKPPSGVASEDLMKKAEDLATQTEPIILAPSAEVEKTSEAAPVTTLPQNLLQLAKIKFNGHLDTYYSYNMNSPAPNATPAANSLQLNPNKTNKYRSFEGYHDQLTLAMALFRIQREEDGNGFVVDLGFGQNTAAMLSYADSTQFIPQAYLKLKMSDSWNFYAGKMLTHMGLESPYSVENWNYSRSLLFTYALPISHTGIAFQYKGGPQFSSTFYIYNNWSGMYEYNRTKNFGLRFDYSPSESLNVKYNVIGGNEKTTVPDSMRLVHDLNATWMTSSQFGLQFEYVMGTENKALAGADMAWNSALIGMLWKNGKDVLDLRAEMYADTNGYSIDGGFGSAAVNVQNITAITLGYTWQHSLGVKTHFECRQDQSDKNVFIGVDGVATNAQMTGALAFTYEF